MLQAEGAFPRLVELIRSKRDDDNGLHKLVLELMFEMSRMQKLTREDLSKVFRSCTILTADLRQLLSTMLSFCIFFSSSNNSPTMLMIRTIIQSFEYWSVALNRTYTAVCLYITASVE
jgi:hypothetical protein